MAWIFKDVYLHSPKKVINGKEELIYPRFCRMRKYPYTGQLQVTVVTIKPDGTTKTMENITLGHIPIMLGSIKCNLYGKTAEELVELGEDLADPFGYFIISSERTVINIDNQFLRRAPKMTINRIKSRGVAAKNPMKAMARI